MAHGATIIAWLSIYTMHGVADGARSLSERICQDYYWAVDVAILTEQSRHVWAESA